MAEREQLKIELQQVNQQINQQTQMRSMEVCMLSEDLQKVWKVQNLILKNSTRLIRLKIVPELQRRLFNVLCIYILANI